MISLQELENLCTDRLEDAKTLFRAGRYDGAFYLAGYVIELGLKNKICRTLDWPGYPSLDEFRGLASFRTHDLEVLLHLSGVETKIKEHFFAEWSIAIAWRPEIRYFSRVQTAESSNNMLTAAEKLLEQL